MQHTLTKWQVKYRYSLILLKELIVTDFKLRYQGSVLGYAWSLLRPLFLFAILYIVFAEFLKIGDSIPHYPVYLLVGIVLWNYFVEITSGSVTSIVGKGDLIRKLSFPRYIIVIAGCASALINLMLNSLVIGLVMFLAGTTITTSDLVFIPLLLVELTFIGLGLAFALSALYVRFRDINYVWEVIVQAAFYATPILYPLAIAPLAAQKYLLLNPIAQVIQDTRHIIVTPDTMIISSTWSPVVWLVPISIAVITCIVGSLYFRNRSKYFAENV